MGSKHILIIDNRINTRGTMLQLFTELGCEMMTTRDEATGLAAAQHGEFDLVILGSDFHPTAGCELLQTLREHNPDLIVLSMNGNGSAPEEVEQIVLRAGMELQVESPPDPRAPYPVQASLRDVEKVHIERVLEHKHWNQSAAAQVLGIDRKTLRNKMREFKLDRTA
jgi:DNA-binding NtrC family response regulator